MNWQPPREAQARVRELLDDAVQDEGFDLVAVLLLTESGRRILRLAVDKPGGVTIGDCTRLSRLLSPLLDVEDPIEGPYILEVSSPGMQRPLQRLADFERFVGYRVQIRMEKGAGRSRYTGRLQGVVGEEILLEVDSKEHRLPFVSIERANLQLTLEEYQDLAGIFPEGVGQAEED